MIGKMFSNAVKSTANAVKNTAANMRSPKQIAQQAAQQKAAAPAANAAEKTINAAKSVGANVLKAATSMKMKKGGSVSARGQGAVMKKRPTKNC
jgi:hypothetical protein